MDINIFQEFNKFNDIVFDDIPHKYYYNNIQLMSTTTYLGNFYEDFDSYNISKNKTAGTDTNVQDRLLKEWDFSALKGGYKGTLIHNYIENFYANKIKPFDTSAKSKLNIINFSDLKFEYDECIRQFNSFHNKTKHILIPLFSEQVIYDVVFGIGGMTDQLFYNLKTKQVELFDWKTNKKFDKENTFNSFKNPFTHLDCSKWNLYSFQLKFYKKIIERNTNIKIGECYIVHLNENNNDFKLIKCKELTDEINLIEAVLENNFDEETQLNKLTSGKLN